MAIHATAIVDQQAELDPTSEIGAYAIIEAHVRVGPGTRIYPHAFIGEHTTIGARCVLHPFCVVGHLPQDLKWSGEPSTTEIGDDTVIREHATIHRGTEGGTKTVVGSNCLIMSTAHVGHNCVLGERVILANGGLLAGHVTVGNRVTISGNVTVHQFVRIGDLVMVAGLTRVPQDVPPFMLVTPHGLIGPNVIGLRRAGLSSAERLELRVFHRLLFRSALHFPEALRHCQDQVRTDCGRRFLDFLSAPSRRGYLGYKGRRPRSAPEEVACES
jgi:UDP-N-acetylglucosamine acyltransferase